MKERHILSTKEMAEIVYRHIQEGIIVLDAKGRVESFNPKAEAVTGYKQSEANGMEYAQTFYHPSLFKDIAGRLEEHADNWEGEVLKRRKNGEIYPEWFNICKIETDLHSFRYVVVFWDMTKQKKAQKELLLAAKVFENINEGVMVTGPDGRIISVNPAFQMVTGYSEEEVIGQNPKLLQSGIHDAKFYSAMWKTIHEKGAWRGEIWNKRKNGEVFPEWLTISSIKNSEGEILNYVAVFTDITDQKIAEKELRKLAHHDPLTGMANRYSYTKRMETLLQTAKRYNQQLAVLFLDLDRFKQINDTLGHDAGDKLLINVADRLQELLRNKDIIARLGGDEFVITLSNIKHPREAFHLAEKIIEVLSHPFWIANQEAYITSSIGISFFPEDGTTIESLLRNADKAMYVAKKQGRNRFAVYHDDLRGPSAELLTIETQLRKAIEREELYLAYQPQISLDTNEIEGIEALIRWNNEILGHIPPGDFIPLAEETGLIIPIGEWVVKQACNDLKKLHLLGFEQLRCAINISPLQFMQEQFVENLVQIAENENIPARMIELELTESTIMPNANHSIQRLVALKKHGFKLSVDDFGTGYSSLSYLSRFPLDYLKIDRSFIKSIDAFDEDSSIVEAILTMAHRLNLRVIAEGVENVKQLRFLRKENCDIVQGFYFSKPKSIDELIDFLYMWDTNWAN